MRKIQLKFAASTNFQPGEEGYLQDSLNYKTTIQQIIRASSGTFRDMEHGLRILQRLDPLELDGVMELEDADWTYLCSRIEDTKWTITDQKIYDFCKYVLEAPPSDQGEEDSAGNRRSWRDPRT